MNKRSRYLLEMVADAVDGIIDIALDIQKGRIYPSQSAYYSGLFRLQKKGLVRKQKEGRRNLYYLTIEGKKILKRPIKKKLRTDGQSTIIIFDIPEEKSRQRTIFRRHLQRNGYTILQRSVLIAPFVISEDTKQLIDELKIRPHISVIEGKINYAF